MRLTPQHLLPQMGASGCRLSPLPPHSYRPPLALRQVDRGVRPGPGWSQAPSLGHTHVCAPLPPGSAPSPPPMTLRPVDSAETPDVEFQLCCLTSEKSRPLSEPQFPQLRMGTVKPLLLPSQGRGRKTHTQPVRTPRGPGPAWCLCPGLGLARAPEPRGQCPAGSVVMGAALDSAQRG